MNGKPLVSIIIIFLNAAKFLEEAIESVLFQTYDNWELFLVDDGSTDNSRAIAWRYVNRKPEKISYLEHPGHQNRGMSAARNLGIKHAKGDYIAFLDADDIWLQHKLEQQVAIMDSHPAAAMVYGATQYWYGWTANPDDVRRDWTPRLGVPPGTLVQPPSLLSLFLRGEAAVPSPCDIIVRREIIEGVGGFEESFPNLYEDQVFYTKVFLKAPVFVSDQCWDRYRQHPESACAIAAKTRLHHSAQLSFLKWVEAYLSKQGVEDTTVWEALQMKLRPYRQPILHRLFVNGRHRIRQMQGLLSRTRATTP